MDTMNVHAFDLVDNTVDTLELVAEEFAPQTHMWSDCLSCAGSASTSATAFTAGTLACIISCGS
jgi:hypothetical protein